MSDTNTDANPDDFFYSDDEVGSGGTKKNRSTVERVIVWGLIVGMLVVAGIEARAKFGYDKWRALVQEKIEDDIQAVLFSDLEKEISGGASVTKMIRLRGSNNQYCRVKWFSLFKTYELLLTCSAAEDPIVIRFQSGMDIPEKFRDVFAALDRGEQHGDIAPELTQEMKDAIAAGENQYGQNRDNGGFTPPMPNFDQSRPNAARQGNAFTRFFRNANEAPKPKFSGRTLPATPLVTVLDEEDAVAALNLTADQTTKIDDLNSRMGDKLIAAPSDREAFLKTQAEIHAEKLETLKTTLTPEQFEVLLGEYASWKGPFGLREPNVAAHLKLTAQQLSELNTVFSSWLDIPAFSRTNAEPNAIKNSLNVLTPAQRTAWDTLVGG